MDLRNEGRFNERPWKLPDGITKAWGVGDMAGCAAPVKTPFFLPHDEAIVKS
ncbi:hypothetical protein [Pseudomonas putida]|uniref:Uncharacterized protein n=1 Tax=Pseudomonas putida TaxID=303 RepID=A0A6S5TXF4_PSEPU|nr:hypothetical protein [Pseudomonas putida]BBT41374.1 hypothetical protein WP8W18C01_37150 [Pseudomonas putida]